MRLAFLLRKTWLTTPKLREAEVIKPTLGKIGMATSISEEMRMAVP